MKKHIVFLMMGLLSVGCNGQKNESSKEELQYNQETMPQQPEGTWRVDKEFDEHGNLIRYDSIYSWSSSNQFDDLTSLDRDSMLKSFKSKFYKFYSNFENQGFDDLFVEDSLFSDHFFNDDFFKSDFGKDFMDIDNIRDRMISRQKKFLEKYRSEFIKPEEDN